MIPFIFVLGGSIASFVIGSIMGKMEHWIHHEKDD